MKKINFIVLLFALSINIHSQKKDEVLAKVGEKVITADEFKNRFELSPQIKRKNSEKGIQKAKEELLYTLIAEKLMAIEAEKLGYDSSISMKMNYVPMEKMNVRDAVYKKEIKSKVELNNKKFSEGLTLANKKYFVDYIYSQNKEAIDSAYQIQLNSKNYDSTAALIKNVEFVKEPYEVTYGKMAIEPETAIFALKKNEFTKPQESPDGWYIFRLLNISGAEYKSIDERVSLVEKTVKNRTEDSLYDSFWNSFFKNKRVITDGNLFWYTADSLQKLVEYVKNRDSVAENQKIQIGDDDFIKFKNSLSPDSLKKDFIKFDKNPMTLNDFLNLFMFEGFYAYSSDINYIAEHLNQRVKRQIEMELLTRYGYELGLQNADEVKSSTEMWKANYLSTLFRKDIVLETKKEFESSEVKSTSEANLFETKLKIVEVLSDSLEIIQKALSIADNTEDLKQFAKVHSQRKDEKFNSGESEYLSAIELGEIGKVVSSMEIGDVFGPLQIEGKYSLFKLVDKKELKIENSGNEAEEKNKENILYKETLDKLENKTVELAEKYGVTINEKLLNSMKLNNLQMMVIRYMGFGGSMLAFPYVSPFYNWKEKLEQKQKEPL